MTAKAVETDRIARFLEAYQDIAKSIGSSLNLRQVMQFIVETISGTMGVTGATICLLDESGKKLDLYASYGLSLQYANSGPFDVRNCIAEVLRGRLVAVYDAASDPRVMHSHEAREEGIESILAIPISIKQEVVGVLRMLSSEKRRYDKGEISFVSSITEQCGIAIENANLYKWQEQQFKSLNIINEITRAVNSTLDLNEVLNIIVHRIPEIMKVNAVTIRLLDKEKQKLEMAAAFGLSQKYLARGAIDAEKNIQLVLQGEPVAIYDVATDPRIQYGKEAKEEGVGSILAVPIRAKGDIIGVMRLLCEEKRHFNKEEIFFAVDLAEIGGIAIKNARMYEHIRSLADEISQLEKDKSVFLQVAAHELKSPVAVIQSLLMTLRSTFKKDLAPSAIELLRRAISRSAGMLDLTRDLLDYSRLTHLSSKDEEKEKIDLVALLKEKTDRFSDLAMQKQITLNSDISVLNAEIIAVRNDPAKVMENLISNAIRYTASGGKADISLSEEDGFAVFQVSDTGIGIPAEDLPNLFNEFFRTSNAKEFNAVASGLGLTIVKSIVDKMNSKISVVSELGSGTTFTVRFPLAKYA